MDPRDPAPSLTSLDAIEYRAFAMSHSLPPGLQRRILEAVDRLNLPAGARVLLPVPGLPGLEKRSLELVAEDDPAPVDGAVVFSRLEKERWDRWALQRLHGRIRCGGALVLLVPNLMDVWSASGLAFLAGRSIRELGRRMTPRPRMPVPERGPFRGRRYRGSALGLALEELGFEIVEHEMIGGAVHRAAAQLAGGVASSTGSHHLVVARKRPSLWGANSKRPFPDVAAHRRRFESRYARFVRSRDEWAARHPAHVAPSAQRFDLERHAGGRALVLSPHPDDEIIGGGGTLRRLIQAGMRVTLLHATDGSDSAALQDSPENVRASVRLEEAARVARSLGVHDVNYWRADNRDFRVTEQHVQAMSEVLARTGPSAVFVPFVIDAHPDHWTLTRIFAEALQRSWDDLDSLEVLNYEVWSLLPANRVCDVTSLMPDIEQRLLEYETALKVDDYVHLCADRLFYNSNRYLGSPGYAEAFLSLTGAEYLGIVRDQERDPVRDAG